MECHAASRYPNRLHRKIMSRRLGPAAGSLGALAVALAWVTPAQAQTLDAKYWINVQAYYPKVDTNVRVSANTAQAIGTDISMEKDLALDDKELLPALSAGGRFGRVVVGADFFKLKRSGSIGLAREIQFDDTTFPVAARVESSFSSDVYRLTVGYAIVSQPVRRQHQWHRFEVVI